MNSISAGRARGAPGPEGSGRLAGASVPELGEKSGQGAGGYSEVVVRVFESLGLREGFAAKKEPFVTLEQQEGANL